MFNFKWGWSIADQQLSKYKYKAEPSLRSNYQSLHLCNVTLILIIMTDIKIMVYFLTVLLSPGLK